MWVTEHTVKLVLKKRRRRRDVSAVCTATLYLEFRLPSFNIHLQHVDVRVQPTVKIPTAYLTSPGCAWPSSCPDPSRRNRTRPSAMHDELVPPVRFVLSAIAIHVSSQLTFRLSAVRIVAELLLVVLIPLGEALGDFNAGFVRTGEAM